jgi:HlyD family secretion protein
MKTSGVEKQGKKKGSKTTLAKMTGLVLILAVVAGGTVLFMFFNRQSSSSTASNEPGIYTVCRGDLPITVTESGDIKAIKSEDIMSKVEGRTTIISIVDEGTLITPEDVNEGKVLVELDSSDIKQKLTQQELSFLSAEAGYTDANESLEIQVKQNRSDINKGQMKVRFALMDLQKYVGGVLKEQELELAKSKFEWTKKLYDKKYVSLSDKEADRLDKERKEIAREKAKTAQKLFVTYEFPKELQEQLSDYDEAKLELERIEASARSKLTQAKANLASKEATYLVQKERLEKLQEQLEACTIRAPVPGEVVYSSSMMDRWERRRRMIEVGAEIRERQKIISIPDTSKMKAEIKIHETWVDKVQPGQEAKITIAAFPDKTFTGKVLKKAPLASPEEWLNPDLKVYATDVSIDGTHDFLKTGMSAKVEIIIDELKDVISVPIQAVVNVEGKKVCFVSNGSSPEQRQVETGVFNDSFVEIKSGLTEGEKVLLNPPRLIESENENK